MKDATGKVLLLLSPSFEKSLQFRNATNEISLMLGLECKAESKFIHTSYYVTESLK